MKCKWADRDSWRLLSRSQLTNVKIIKGRSSADVLEGWVLTVVGNLTRCA